jgi:FMN phosphatase YigB (HAD superfamily)
VFQALIWSVLAADLAGTGLAGYIDAFVTSAEAGYRKPHTRIYQATLELAGFKAQDAVFVGDSLRTDALRPQRVGIRSVLVTRAKAQGHREQVASLGDAAPNSSKTFAITGDREAALNLPRAERGRLF